MIIIRFEKLYRHERVQEPCSVAVPVKMGLLRTVQEITLVSKARVLPSQTIVTGRWADGSIRWFLTRFQANLPANQKAEYELYLKQEEVPSDVIPLEKEYGNVLQEDSEMEGNITADTGCMRARIKSGSGFLFEELSGHGIVLKESDITGPVLTDADGKRYSIWVESWRIAENGPLCAIAEGIGKQRAADGAKRSIELRLTFHRGKSFMEMAYRIINDSDMPLELKELTLTVKNPHTDQRTVSCAASSNYGTSYTIGEEGEAVERRIDAQHLLYESNEHMAEVFYGTLFASYQSDIGGVCATIFQAQQNYPKAVRADRNELTVYLVPEGAGRVVMQSGMAREQKVQLHLFGMGYSLQKQNCRSLMYQMPDRPYVDAEVYEEAKVFPEVFVKNKNQETEIALIQKADAHSRCYGMLNWGDSPDLGYTMQGRGNGKSVWTNNEYDFPHACAIQYARTGIRRFLDYLLVAGRHWMDVDVCHYSSDPLIYGGQWEHCRGHVLDSKIVCSHQWVEGLLDYYHFTGEQSALKTALGIGENILRLLETPMFQQKGEINARETGWAMRSLTALYLETQDEKWLAKCEWIVGHFENWAEEYGGWLSPYTDNTAIRVPFMIGVAVGSLMRYYSIKPQEKIKRMILSAVDDLIENAYEEYGVFFYKELPSLSRPGSNTIILEALTAAARLSGDENYLEYGKKTFQQAMSGWKKLGAKKVIEDDAVIVSGEGTKAFAQSFLPMALYYKVLMDGVEVG